MGASEAIRKVEALGGRLLVDSNGLRLQASKPLPDDLVAAVGKEKVAIMLALGVPFNLAIASVLAELRPHLPPSLRRLPDDRLMILINWSIMASFSRATMKVAR